MSVPGIPGAGRPAISSQQGCSDNGSVGALGRAPTRPASHAPVRLTSVLPVPRVITGGVGMREGNHLRCVPTLARSAGARRLGCWRLRNGRQAASRGGAPARASDDGPRLVTAARSSWIVDSR